MSTGPPPLPESGEIAFQLVGDLTIHDVSQQVVWDVTARVEGKEVIGQAKTNFTFDDFNLTPPRVPLVLSVEDNLRLEIDFRLRHQCSGFQ